jgi:phosphatidylserine decarboxylase
LTVATFAATRLIKALPRVRLSRAVGRLCEQPLPPLLSRAVSGAFCRAYRVDMREAAPQRGTYKSFDAFFTRRLRTGSRPISTASIVSPADGELSATGPVDAGTRILVKGNLYEVGELVGDTPDAARYCGGSFVVVYLSPGDYHRVHAPADGAISVVRAIPGDLYPVNSLGERLVPRLLVCNERVAIVIDTPSLGRVTVVMVAAVIVGRITVSALKDAAPIPGTTTLKPPQPVTRGDEIGIFHLGSTVVVFVEPHVKLCRPEGPVRYGQSLLAAS